MCPKTFHLLFFARSLVIQFEVIIAVSFVTLGFSLVFFCGITFHENVRGSTISTTTKASVHEIAMQAYDFDIFCVVSIDEWIMKEMSCCGLEGV